MKSNQSKDIVAKGHMALENLVDYQWKLSLGETELTEAEFNALANLKAPLVQIRGQWVMLDAEQKIYRYFIRSASYPNWPALAVAAPGNIIPDFPLINKSFELCYACLDR